MIISSYKLFSFQKNPERVLFYFKDEVYETEKAGLCHGNRKSPNVSGLFFTCTTYPWQVHVHHRMVDVGGLSISYWNDLETQIDEEPPFKKLPLTVPKGKSALKWFKPTTIGSHMEITRYSVTHKPLSLTSHIHHHTHKKGVKKCSSTRYLEREKWKHLANSTIDNHIIELKLRDVGYCLKSHR